MPPRTGSYSRFIFDEAKRYYVALAQKNVPLVDADFNDAMESLFTLYRRTLQFTVGTGSPNNGFKIEESTSSNVNNFTIKGGDGTAEGAGRFFVDGFQAILENDADFLDNQSELHSIITGLTDTELTDSAANFDTNELVGRELVPDIENPGSAITITSNTATTITVASGLLAASQVGKFYRVNPSTPSGGNRTDVVYIDCYLDEVDATEDANLLHAFAFDAEAMRRLKLRQIVRIKENATTAPPNFTDVDGNVHAIGHLATVNRLDGNNQITSAMITDERDLIADLLTFKNELADARASDLLGTFTAVDDRLEAAEDRFDLVANSPLVRSLVSGVINLDLPDATPIAAGALSAADKAKLDGIEAGATAGTIKAVEVSPDDFGVSLLGNVDIDTEVDDTDASVYLKIVANDDSQITDFVYEVLMLEDQISQIIIPHKFTDLTGNNALTIRVVTDDGSGTIIITESAILSTSRTETIINSGDLGTPLPIDRFLLKVRVVLDTADEARVGKIKVVFA